MREDRYHHGNLRRALLDAAAAEIAEKGPGAISLRSIARRAGVSHAGPAHHFGDRAGLLSAVAAEGFRRMDEAMVDAAAGADDLLTAVGRAYVDFAVAHPGEFAVMFRRELLNPGDSELAAHGGATWQRLVDGIAAMPVEARGGEPTEVVAARAWSLVHGLATLIINGSLSADDELVDRVLRGV
jgi:AcrR family transcriptional regulator